MSFSTKIKNRTNSVLFVPKRVNFSFSDLYIETKKGQFDLQSNSASSTRLSAILFVLHNSRNRLSSDLICYVLQVYQRQKLFL